MKNESDLIALYSRPENGGPRPSSHHKAISADQARWDNGLRWACARIVRSAAAFFGWLPA